MWMIVSPSLSVNFLWTLWNIILGKCRQEQYFTHPISKALQWLAWKTEVKVWFLAALKMCIRAGFGKFAWSTLFVQCGGVILHRITKITNFGAKMRCPTVRDAPLKVPESDFNCKMMLQYVEYNIYLYQLMNIGHYI